MRVANRNRALLDMAKQRFAGKTSTLSYLRGEVVLKNNVSVYKFSLLSKSEATSPLACLGLDSTDAFICDKIGFFLSTRKKSQSGVERLYTHPFAGAFPSVTAATNLASGSPADFKNWHLNLIYNGSYKITLDNRVYFEKMDMYRHLFVPNVQTTEPQSSKEDPSAGFVNLEPYLILHGERKHEIEVSLPSIANMQIEAVRQTNNNTDDKEHILVLMAYGMLVSSGGK